MEIKKGQLLNIQHNRKGNFYAIADEDFDSDKTEFYPVRVASRSEGGYGVPIQGLSNQWKVGEQIPCRKDFVILIKAVE